MAPLRRIIIGRRDMDDINHPTRRDVVVGAAAIATLPALSAPFGPVFAAEGQTSVSGFVFEDRDGSSTRGMDSRGIPGILVTNGKDVAKTDADGRYVLPLEDETIIFVIKPAGFSVPVDAKTMLPRFYHVHQPKGSPT